MQIDTPRRFTLVVRSVAALALAAVLAGCGDAAPGPDPNSAEFARLTKAIEGLAESNASLQTEVRRQARRIDALSRDAASKRAAPAPATTTGALGGDPTEPVALGADQPLTSVDGEPILEDGATVGTILATEKGKQAIQKAAAVEIAKREAQDRRTFVSFSIGMFARKANLDERQTKELQGIWKRSLDNGVKLRAQFAEMRDLPESERPAAREKAMEFMRDLGRQRTEEVADLLDAGQLEMYETTETEIVAGLHGGSRRPASESKEARASEE